MKIRICWQSKITGVEGHGEWQDDSAALRQLYADVQRCYPDLDHWLEYEIEVTPCNESHS